jgi:hypothetical protein
MRSVLSLDSPKPLTALVALFALAFFAFSVVNMARRGPYPMHPDEAFITEHAWAMVGRADLNPQFYSYGSLPLYLSAASLGAAAMLTLQLGEIESLDDVEPVAYPYYSHPSISYAPRWLFALFASVALGAVAMIGFRLRPRWELVLVPVLALMVHPLFQTHAWSYVNVDILVAMLAACALAYLLALDGSASFRARVLVPALISGAALATKYNAALLLLPFAVFLARPPYKRAALELCCLALATISTFLLLQPYAVLDWSHFSDAVLREMHHYRTGHPNHEGEPGLAQLLFHLRHFYKDFGPVLSALLMLGVVYGMVVERRKTLLVLLFPLGALLFMSMQRVNFPRNLLAAQVCLSVFVGMGLLAFEAGLRRAWARIRRGKAAPHVQDRPRYAWCSRCIGPVLVMIVFWTAPESFRPQGDLSFVEPDSRQLVADFLIDRAPKERCRLLVPVELGVSPNTIKHHCRLWTFEVGAEGATPEGLAEGLAPLRKRRHIYIALPRWKDGAEHWNALPPLLALERPVLKVGHLKKRLNERRMHGNPRIDLFELGVGESAPD